ARGSGGGGALRPAATGRRGLLGAVAGSPVGTTLLAAGSVSGRSTIAGIWASAESRVWGCSGPSIFAGAAIAGEVAGFGGIFSGAWLARGGSAGGPAARVSSAAA